MLIELFDDSWSNLVLLSEEISIELGVLSTEFVWSSLVVMGLQMSQELRCHMGVIRTGSNGWEHQGSCLFMALSRDQPAGEDNAAEVCK